MTEKNLPEDLDPDFVEENLIQEGPFTGIGRKLMQKKLRRDIETHNDEMDNEVNTRGSEREYTAAFEKAQRKNAALNRISGGIKEESIAGATLRAGSRNDENPKSRVEHLKSVIGAMHSMSSDELTKWYKEAMDLIGKETSHLPGSANVSSNRNSLNMKASNATGSGGASSSDPMPRLDHKSNPLASSMKEDVEEMFDGEDLSEEFREKASTIFEAAVTARTLVEMARLEEEYEERLQEEVTSIAESLESSLDSYLDYVVDNWMKDNEVAIESTLRSEIMEGFVDGMKNLFAEHYIDVPTEKVNVIEELASKVEELEIRLDDSINENVQLKKTVLESTKTDILEEVAEDLNLVQSEKFFALAEGVVFDGDLNAYKRKLSYVKENYFPTSKNMYTNIEEETFEGNTSSINESVSNDPAINRYAQIISRTVKNR